MHNLLEYHRIREPSEVFYLDFLFCFIFAALLLVCFSGNWNGSELALSQNLWSVCLSAYVWCEWLSSIVLTQKRKLLYI